MTLLARANAPEDPAHDTQMQHPGVPARPLRVTTEIPRIRGPHAATDAAVRLVLSLPLAARFALVVLLSAATGWIDYITGPDLSFSLFYLLPISLATWFVGLRFGTTAAVACAAIWMLVDQLTGRTYAEAWLPIWNGSIRLGFFLVTTVLLWQLLEAHQWEQSVARTDTLTGLSNRRSFGDAIVAILETSRHQSLPFTLAYADLDHFKQVNDTLGHLVGDEVLKEIASAAQRAVRPEDVVARKGGDEYAILLPGADVQIAHAVLARVQESVRQAMGARGWSVGLTVGAVTFVSPPRDVTEAIRLADDLMLEVKSTRRGDLAHAVATLGVRDTAHAAVAIDGLKEGA